MALSSKGRTLGSQPNNSGSVPLRATIFKTISVTGGSEYMSRDSNAKKTALLGIPHGTAQHRLRKNILFHTLKKFGENKCFKCEKDIESSDDLSIEHKKAWQSGGSPALFWDMENIAFSHLKCNRPEVQAGGRKPFTRPEGMNWCVPGQHFAPIEDFYKDVSNLFGLQNWCKAHRYERKVSVPSSAMSKPSPFQGG
jgi:hypothetical protein